MYGRVTIATPAKLAFVVFWAAFFVVMLLSAQDRSAIPVRSVPPAGPAQHTAADDPSLRTAAPVPATDELERLAPHRPKATPRRAAPQSGIRPGLTAHPLRAVVTPAPRAARAVPTQEPVPTPPPVATAAPVPVSRTPVARQAPRPPSSERFESDGGSGDFELGDPNP